MATQARARNTALPCSVLWVIVNECDGYYCSTFRKLSELLARWVSSMCTMKFVTSSVDLLDW